MWSEGGGESRGLEGWLEWSASLLGGAVCRLHVYYPVFAPTSQKWQLGFLTFCILLFIICPNCAWVQLFLVPYRFFVFCCSGAVSPGASTEKRFPVPRSQLVSMLSEIWERNCIEPSVESFTIPWESRSGRTRGAFPNILAENPGLNSTLAVDLLTTSPLTKLRALGPPQCSRFRWTPESFLISLPTSPRPASPLFLPWQLFRWPCSLARDRNEPLSLWYQASWSLASCLCLGSWEGPRKCWWGHTH